VQELVLSDNRRDAHPELTKEKARCSKQNSLPETHESLQYVAEECHSLNGRIEAKFSRSPKGFHMIPSLAISFPQRRTSVYSRNEMQWYKWLK
jgi:hypothetical protein